VVLQIPLLLKLSAALCLTVLMRTTCLSQDPTSADTTAGPARFGWIAYPYIFYSPETNLAFGLGGFVFFRFSPDSTIKPSSITPSAYYSVNDQFDVTVIPEFYIGRSLYIYSYFSFGNYIDKFYGIGPESVEIDNPEYDHESIVVQLNLQPQISETFRAGLYSRFLRRTILDARMNPFLSDPSLSGSTGGTSIGLGGVVAWDTRDHRFYPTSGILNEIRAVFYSKAWGSDFDYNKYEIDLRGYHSLGEKDEHIIGVQFFGVSTTSRTPFYDMALLGSKTIMRGYYQGRYRDQVYVAGQGEYRTRLFWRIGFVAFAGLGQVAPRLKELELRRILPNYGFGLRYQFDVVEKLDIRFDMGFGKNTSGVYFDVQQAF
jgi:outer membrane protein assembly factor BamA